MVKALFEGNLDSFIKYVDGKLALIKERKIGKEDILNIKESLENDYRFLEQELKKAGGGDESKKILETIGKIKETIEKLTEVLKEFED